jgi:hypothetical protein
MPYEALHRALHTLQATGSEGFEGFIQALISRLTGHRFFLAKAGFQAGKDASTAAHGATYVDIECKRHQRGSAPSVRELQGGLAAAIDASDRQLDLWLLVSTGAIGALEAEALNRMATREAVAVVIVDWQESELPQLGLLCAAFCSETLKELENRGVTDSLHKVAEDLAAMTTDPGFGPALEGLRNRLNACELGFAQTRAIANEWIETRLANHIDAKAAFNHTLCVADTLFQPYVDRQTVESALTTWHNSWASTLSVATVLGDEGNGKSWAVMGWWKRLAGKPLTLLVTSKGEAATDCLTLLATTLHVQTDGTRDVDFWKKRLRQWSLRPSADHPWLLLVLDGLNERARFRWNELFASLRDSRWRGQVAVAATSRPAFWFEQVLPKLMDVPVSRIDVPPFNDAELSRAWAGRQPPLAEMPDAVRTFIRTPRILRRALLHIERIMETGDLTVERLFIEDWADRIKTKTGLSHSSGQFNSLVIELGRELRSGLGEFESDRLRTWSVLARRSPARDLDRDFDEIIEGHLFEQVDGASERFRVRPQFVGLALGLLLARECRDSYRASGESGVSETLAEALDPVSDFDQASSILHAAFAVSFLEPGYPAEIRRLLAARWLRLPNLPPASWNDFAAYLPLDRELFFDLAEDFWIGVEVYSTGREWIADAILRWRELPSLHEVVKHRCLSWLGLWHPDWHAPNADDKPSEREDHRRKVKDAVTHIVLHEWNLPAGLIREAGTPQGPSIAPLAFLLVSHVPLAPHVTAFAAWALSRSIMQFPWEFDEVAWCLRLNNRDPIETERLLLRQVEDLCIQGNELGVRAARLLLQACGTPAAAVRLAELPAQTLPSFRWPQPVLPVDPTDPEAPAPDTLTPAYQLIDNISPNAVRTAFGSTIDDHRLETVEPFLARFEPIRLAMFYRAMLRTILDRRDLSLRQIVWDVPKLILLCGDEEDGVLDTARHALLPLLESHPRDADVSEAYIVLGLLCRRAAPEQLDLLLSRPEGARDLLSFEGVFAESTSQFACEAILALKAETRGYQIRRVLWFLAATPISLDADAGVVLASFLSHHDSLVRAAAFRLAVRTTNRTALHAHLVSSWRPMPEASLFEVFYGSLALIESATPAHYRTLRNRIDFDLLGYLAYRDGSEEAFAEFGRDLDSVWESTLQHRPQDIEWNVVGQLPVPDSPSGSLSFDLISLKEAPAASARSARVLGRTASASDVDKFFSGQDLDSVTREQRQFEERVSGAIQNARREGRLPPGYPMRAHGFKEALRLRPDLVHKWETRLGQSVNSGWDAVEFYRVVCGALAEGDPDRAVNILAALRKCDGIVRTKYVPLGIDALTWLAFCLPRNAGAERLRSEILEEAQDDALLTQVGLAAQARGATAWLERQIAQDLGAAGLFIPARGLALLSCLDDTPLLKSLRVHLKDRIGFLADVAQWAQDRLTRNIRARYWFQEFLTRRDSVEAWGAFRLFVLCVDRRFYLWRDVVCGGLEIPLIRRRFLAINDQEIRRATERNEDRLSDTLFGIRVAQNEIAPWYRSPASAVVPEKRFGVSDHIP